MTNEYSDSVEAGQVINQNPSYRTKVEQGTEIDLIISKGTKRDEGITVPNLYGMTVDEAKSTLGGLNLKLGSRSEEESDEPVGTIIRQSVSVDSVVEPGTKVSVTISKGPKKEVEATPSPEPSEAPVESEPPVESESPVESEEPTETTQSVMVNLPTGTEVKESYHIVAKLTLDDGTSSTKELDVTQDQFPFAISFQGKGTGVVDIFIDGVSASQDRITF